MTASAGMVTVSRRRTGAGGVLGSVTGARLGSVSALPYPDVLPASRLAQRSSGVEPASRDGHVSEAESAVRGALLGETGAVLASVTLGVLRGVDAGVSWRTGAAGRLATGRAAGVGRAFGVAGFSDTAAAGAGVVSTAADARESFGEVVELVTSGAAVAVGVISAMVPSAGSGAVTSGPAAACPERSGATGVAICRTAR